MRFVCTLIFCLLPFTAALANSAEKYPRCSLDTRAFDLSKGLAASGLDVSRLVEPDRARVLFDEDLKDYAVEAKWKPGDFIAYGYRTEVADQCLIKEGVPVYYRLSFQIPKDMPLDPERSVLIGQFHTPDKNHKPQIALRYRGTGHFDITFNFKSPDMPGITASQLQKKPIRILNLVRGEWHTLELLVVWTSDMDGRTDVVFNGWHVLRYQGPTNFASQKGRGPYFKFGLYPSDGNSAPLRIRHGRYSRTVNPSSDFLMARNFYSEPMRLEQVTYMAGAPRRKIFLAPAQ